MKLSKLVLPLIGLCIAAAGSVRASDIPIFITTFSLKVSAQNTTTTNGSIATTPPPASKSYTLANLLTRIGQDLSQNFAGGKLAVISSDTNSSFVITDSTGTNILADVSAFFNVQEGDFEIFSGAQNINTGLASPKGTRSHVFRLGFDDTGVGTHSDNLSFFIQGIMTEMRSDTSPSGGVYNESRTVKMLNAVGEGTDGTAAFLCTGSIMGSGKATRTL